MPANLRSITLCRSECVLISQNTFFGGFEILNTDIFGMAVVVGKKKRAVKELMKRQQDTSQPSVLHGQ